jgi:hypothetical protein
MQQPEKNQNHRHSKMLVVLFVGLCSIYMLTYSARIESTDTLFLFDAAGSLIRFGDLKLDTSAGVRPPLPNVLRIGSGYTPLPDVDTEPLQIVLASPLYWLASHIPDVGLIHAVYLFNVLVSAAAGCVLYLYTRTLGYSAKVGVLAALLLAMGSIVWPYSKTFFQEPLALLLVLIAALLLEKWRASGYRAFGWLLLALVAALGAPLSKAAVAMALPALVVIAAPRLTPRRLILLVGVVAGLMIVVLLAAEPLGISGRISRTLDIIRRPSPYAGVALHTYLLSIGGSVWGTSPVMLLAIPGLWLSRSWRHGLALLVMLLSFAVVYAFWQGPNWFGGLSWPPRFLIPVVPFGLIAGLPALDRALRRPLPNLMTIITAVLFAYGFWVQLSAVTLRWNEYLRGLPPEANGLGEWGGGLNVVQYLRWVVIPSLWSQSDLDIVWARANVLWGPLAFGLLVLICGWLLWRLLRSRPVHTLTFIGLPVLFIIVTFFGLRAVYADPLYGADNPALRDMQAIMDSEASGEVVLLSDLAYERYFTNGEHRNGPRIIGLPFQPGEQPSPEQPPEVTSENPDVLVDRSTGPFIYALAQTRERLFVLASSGPFLPWSVRPVERFMAAHYYPLREWTTGPQVRLIEYDTTPAPDLYALLGPQYLTDLTYGDETRLIGYELPRGTTYAPGDALPLSLYWQTDAPLDASYKVAWFVRDVNGGPLAQGWDVEPGAGFHPTNIWRPNVPLWDNRALRLPSDTPPGEYRLWVVLYSAAADGSVANLPVTGSETLEGYIGVLPTSIQVSE